MVEPVSLEKICEKIMGQISTLAGSIMAGPPEVSENGLVVVLAQFAEGDPRF
jgi:hypothetical protein